ncbi:hypothetical protein Acr_06g0011510 [Actinidia rufa]|uniref:Uncharacterized protein n=1 Tax=Actinidia rufa TaxID=165716 RepID=A0A7J0ERV6_9ERIC|nr:hypothetical protein Acr_06g0011510 [Actinidia rufa]
MALSSHSSAHTILTASHSSTLSLPKLLLPPSQQHSSPNTLSFPPPKQHNLLNLSLSDKWSTKVSFFPTFFTKTRDAKPIKEELLEAIKPLDRGADASPEDQQRIDQVG